MTRIPPSDLAEIQRAYDATRAVLERNQKMTRIVTRNIWPPIPTKQYDWCAYYEDTEETGHYGYGETEQAAITDLLEEYEDPADDRSIGLTRAAVEGR